MAKKKRSAPPAPPRATTAAAATPAARGPITLWVLAGTFAALGFVYLGSSLDALGISAGPNYAWAIHALIQTGTISLVLLIAAATASVTIGTRIDAALARAKALILAPSPRQFALAISALAFVLSAFLAWYCFHGDVYTGDEFSQGFEVRLLLHGRLSALPEQYREFFNTGETFDLGNRWFSQFPIGGAFFLAIGAACHAAWLVNPIFVGWTARNVYRFARATGDESFARWTALLFAVSSFPLFMAATQLNHAATLAFISWGLSAFPAWATATDAGGMRRSAAVMGVAFAVAAMVRPYDAALVALVVGGFQLHQLYRERGGPDDRLRSLVVQFAAGVIPVALLLYANTQTTGSPLLFGYDALNGPQHRPGFHTDPKGDAHTIFRGVMYTSAYLIHLQYALFEGPIPALVLVIVGLIVARPVTRWDAVMAAVIVAIMGGYAAYWHEGAVLAAPRFYHVVVPAFIWFAARGTAVLSRSSNPILRRTAQLAIPLCIAVAWGLPSTAKLWSPFIPERAPYFGVRTEAALEHAPPGPRRPDVVADVRAAKLTNALVLVRESWHGSLAARLRAIGAPPLLTESWIPTVDACALQLALDAVPPGTEGLEAINWVVGHAKEAGEAEPVQGREGNRDLFLGLVPGRALAPVCQRELTLDEAPPIPYAHLLTHADFDADGRLGGAIVYARDLGVRDTLLRARFSNREWYRYVPGPLHGTFIHLAK